MHNLCLTILLAVIGTALAQQAAPAVILPNPVVLQATGSAPAAVTITCINRENLLPAGSKCVVSDCLTSRVIECNNISSSDLGKTLSDYAKNHDNEPYGNPGTNLPLQMRLVGITGNLTKQSVQPVAGSVKKLELINSTIDNLSNDTFSGFAGLNHMDFNGVQNEVIPAGVFDSLKNLQILQIRNMSNLRVLEKGSFESVLNRNKSCVSLDISGGNFVCDCKTNSWIQQTLQSKVGQINQGSVVSIFTDKYAIGSVPCGIAVVCSDKSADDFKGKKLMNVNVTVACDNSTKKMNTEVVTTTSKPTGAAGTATNSLWATSLFVVFCGILARV